ncbi:hypothetical protein [Shimia biformata]|uniref:hypothetical protein n=1 Tax=Shimia biformata TaxID=1294299 RepID=UPI001951A14C|nr:hypothetical protein [Shimia biformata]
MADVTGIKGEIVARVRAFLDTARRTGARGDFAQMETFYDFPVSLIYADHTKMLDAPADLHRHLESLNVLSDGSAGPIWYQEVLAVVSPAPGLVVATVDVHRITLDAHPAEPHRQTLVLRVTADGFRFAAIVNPIVAGFWKESDPATSSQT